ncbi:hypothetical protein EB796_007335 [Bugula neritina]|uniref:SH2 domain-containing protein n=1 Tax=Bugula neritina TaxID=10212 RepID=A0A7J7K6W0_BUGNE|nr:hypothetical protein EB796_007335 [Bugula neritina]
MDVLADLKERQRQLKDTYVPASMPRNPAPGKPIPPANKPVLPAKKPVPSANKPLMPVNKPILPVKPRMLEKIYWNGSKEDATRVVRESNKGTFLIRWGSTGNQKVLVVSDGGGESHSLKINEFSNGQMGLKNEALSSDLEKFSSVDALVKFYKETPINLRSGAVEIKLKIHIHSVLKP